VSEDPEQPTGHPTGHPSGADEPVGSAAEEAARLIGAVSDWAREHAGGLGAGVGGLAAQMAAAVHEVDEHVATGAPECRWCPVCRTVHALRTASPEVREHLSVAAASLAQAAAALMATDIPDDARPRRGHVEHIDLTDETDERS
jgi:hypothetical protein